MKDWGLGRIGDARVVHGSGVLLLALGLFGAPTSAGCENDARADRRHVDAGTSARATRGPSTTTVEPLDEARSADVLSTLNGGEIELARVATQRTTNTDVRRFAEEMIAGHSAAQERVDAWVLASRTSPVDNPVSDDVESHAREVRTRLDAASAADFDRVYVESQVAMHESALHLLDERIIPGAREASFRPLVEHIRGDVAHHLEMARSLAARIHH